MDEKNIKLFTLHNVLSETEIRARHDIYLGSYVRILNIEALTMLDMARKDIFPAVSSFTDELSRAASGKSALIAGVDVSYETDTVKDLCCMLSSASKSAGKLEEDLIEARNIEDLAGLAEFYKTRILDDMSQLRVTVDQMEMITSAEKWPYPSYGQLLFGVR